MPRFGRARGARGRGRGGRGRGKGRGEGWPFGTSASAIAFARSLLDDRSAKATASVLLLSWAPAWRTQLAPHGPPNRREGEVRRCGSVNVTFSKRRELLHRGRFDAIALIHHVRSMQREAALPRGERAVNVMYSIEPPGWKPKLEPTHRAAFTRQFGLALSYEQAKHPSDPTATARTPTPISATRGQKAADNMAWRRRGRPRRTPRRRTSSRTTATRSSRRWGWGRCRHGGWGRAASPPPPALPTASALLLPSTTTTASFHSSSTSPTASSTTTITS